MDQQNMMEHFPEEIEVSVHDQNNSTTSEDTKEVDENMLGVLHGWVTTEVLREQRSFLQEHLELLTPRSDAILHEVMESCQVSEDVEERQQVWLLRNFLNILSDVRVRGGTTRAVLEAYINVGGGFACNLPPWLQALEESGVARSTRDLPQQRVLQRIEQLQATLQQVTEEPTNPPEIQAELFVLLGQAQTDVQLRRQLSLNNAMLFYEAALKIYTKARYPYQYAKIQVELGLAYSQITTQERALALERSISYYEKPCRFWHANSTRCSGQTYRTTWVNSIACARSGSITKTSSMLSPVVKQL